MNLEARMGADRMWALLQDTRAIINRIDLILVAIQQLYPEAVVPPAKKPGKKK